MTSQQKMQELLNKVSLPSKDIKCFGSQVVITCFSRKAADDWAFFLSNFCKIRNVLECFDKDKYGHHSLRVFRTFAVIKGSTNE